LAQPEDRLCCPTCGAKLSDDNRLTIDHSTLTVYWDGKTIFYGSRQTHSLFILFYENLGKLVTKDKIFETLWGVNEPTHADGVVKILVFRIRKSIKAAQMPLVVYTNYSLGYMMARRKNHDRRSAQHS
jgi:DNA-binding response OmpR family regulator